MSAVLAGASADARVRTSLAVADESGPHAEDEQRRAEHMLVRDGIIGAVVGMILGAVVWAVMVLISLSMVDGDWDTATTVGMGALVGMFAGAFYGGWAGTVIGNRALERAEHTARASHH